MLVKEVIIIEQAENHQIIVLKQKSLKKRVNPFIKEAKDDMGVQK